MPHLCGTVGSDSNGGKNPRMTLILRMMKKHMGWEDAKDDYAVLDDEKSVGRIYKEAHGDPRWCWSINTSPYPAPAPHNGVAATLDAAKQEFKTRYEEMKRMGVRPFSGGQRCLETSMENAAAGLDHDHAGSATIRMTICQPEERQRFGLACHAESIGPQVRTFNRPTEPGPCRSSLETRAGASMGRYTQGYPIPRVQRRPQRRVPCCEERRPPSEAPSTPRSAPRGWGRRWRLRRKHEEIRVFTSRSRARRRTGMS
jgi:hypothetical protein